jgi:hypothetical protein
VLPGKSRYCTGCDLEFKTAKPAAATRGRPRKHVITVKAESATVEQVIRQWNAGVSLGEIAGTVGMDPDDVAIILIDLARQGRIRRREGGALGVR